MKCPPGRSRTEMAQDTERPDASMGAVIELIEMTHPRSPMSTRQLRYAKTDKLFDKDGDLRYTFRCTGVLENDQQVDVEQPFEKGKPSPREWRIRQGYLADTVTWGRKASDLRSSELIEREEAQGTEIAGLPNKVARYFYCG